MIVAPHTSNWDFVLGISAVFALGLRVRFLGKHTLFNPPLGWLMRWFGGTPVIREAPQGAVAQAVAMIEREPAVFLAITPEGTRTRGGPWRSGFYHIAHAARVPILPIAFDGGHRAIRLFRAVRDQRRLRGRPAASCMAPVRRHPRHQGLKLSPGSDRALTRR